MGDGDEDTTRGQESGPRGTPLDWVACPTCEGTGQQLPADGRTCPVCAGTGLVTAEVAETILESEVMEVRPKDDE